MKFYASVRIDIRPSSTLKDKKEQPIGRHAKVKIAKNKVAPPFKRAEFDIMFGEGISRTGEIVDLGVEYDIIKKSGSWFSYNGDKLAQGRDAVKQLLADNPELFEELEAKITEAIKGDPEGGAPKKAKLSLKKDADEKDADNDDFDRDDTEEEGRQADLDLDDFPDEDFSIDDDARD